MSHLKRLHEQRSELIAAAQSLTPRNFEDDELIRCGIVGFAQHVSLREWDSDCYQHVRDMSDEDLGDDFPLEWRRFTALASGYFLGMHVGGLISELDLRLASHLTPGFMWSNSESFDGPPLPEEGAPPE